MTSSLTALVTRLLVLGYWAGGFLHTVVLLGRNDHPVISFVAQAIAFIGVCASLTGRHDRLSSTAATLAALCAVGAASLIGGNAGNESTSWSLTVLGCLLAFLAMRGRPVTALWATLLMTLAFTATALISGADGFRIVVLITFPASCVVGGVGLAMIVRRARRDADEFRAQERLSAERARAIELSIARHRELSNEITIRVTPLLRAMTAGTQLTSDELETCARIGESLRTWITAASRGLDAAEGAAPSVPRTTDAPHRAWHPDEDVQRERQP